MLNTLISITILSTQAPGVVVTTSQIPSRQSCSSVMTASAEGAAAIYKANSQSIHRDVGIEIKDGWTVVSSGMGREVARFKCVE